MEGGHQVNLKPFLMGKYLITQRQYQAVMGHNHSHFQGNLEHPVEKVTWHDAITFCQKLSQILKKTIDLPSETQWEWAARGATQSNDYIYAGSNNLDEVGWYRDNANKITHLVGQKKPNELGIYDMSGNVWEWCKDNWTDDLNLLPKDGSALIRAQNISSRAMRGGCWYLNTNYCCCVHRFRDRENYMSDSQGFRVVLSRFLL
jgi:formylglycine-generating enzyme required for sulfatase activity